MCNLRQSHPGPHSRNTYSGRSRARGYCGALALSFALLIGAACSAPALAGDTGTLKLKVAECTGGTWLSNAYISVEIYRNGSGVVDSDSGYTNSTGYIEFTFTDLEIDDEARVTVTPSGQSPDDDHTYIWDGNDASKPWDISTGQEDSCEDSWYSEKDQIIKCVYYD